MLIAAACYAASAITVRLLAQRASFMDTPPEEQDRIFRLSEEILAALEDRTD